MSSSVACKPIKHDAITCNFKVNQERKYTPNLTFVRVIVGYTSGTSRLENFD